MAKHRKTHTVSALVDMCNRMLANPKMSDEYRQGVASVLEGVLHDTGNYAGYNYLAWCVEKGEDGLTGCERWRKDSAEAGAPMWRDTVPALPTTPYLGNDTRRVYYKAHMLHTRSKPEERDLHYPKRLT